MIEACKAHILSTLTGIMGDETPFPFDDGNVFFTPLPRDFLKSNPFAVCCLIHTDKKRAAAKMMANTRSDDFKYYTRIYRRFERQILFRVLLFAGTFTEQWGKPDVENLWDFDAYKGIVNIFEQRISEVRIISDELDCAVRIQVQDSFRPWDDEEARQTLTRRQHKAVVRVEFTGGIYVTKKIPIIQDVDIQPQYQ